MADNKCSECPVMDRMLEDDQADAYSDPCEGCGEYSGSEFHSPWDMGA